MALTADVIALATQYERYGYRRITALLHAAGWTVDIKTGRADLAAGGAESAAEAAEEGPSLTE